MASIIRPVQEGWVFFTVSVSAKESFESEKKLTYSTFEFLCTLNKVFDVCLEEKKTWRERLTYVADNAKGDKAGHPVKSYNF
jgi:hypothetical protein